MNFQTKPLTPGVYFVATPIGAARDITLRALDILASADLIASEDTRTTRKLMEIHGIPLGDRQIVAYHDHSGIKPTERLVAAVANGQSVAYVSEAGTPLIADPGFELGVAVAEAGLPVTAAPGASAALMALTVSGLPTDRFFFVGFLPNTSAKRKTEIADLKNIPATLIFYESPKRIRETLADLCDILGGCRPAALCRELTKKFEEVTRGTLAEVADAYADRSVKGEIVLLVGRGGPDAASETSVEDALKVALQTMRVKDAATAVAGALGLARRDVYQVALKMGKQPE